MKQVIIAAVIVLFSHSLIAQESKFDTKTIRLHKVKEIESTAHIYKNEYSPDWKGKIQLEKYDEKGNLIYLSTFNKTGKLGVDVNYLYDEHGNIKFEKAVNHLTGAEDSLTYFNFYKDGKLIRQERSDTLFTSEWTYNSKGQLIRKLRHNRIDATLNNVELVEKPEIYVYDKKGNRIEEYRVDGDFKIRETFKFEKSRLIERKWAYVKSEYDKVGETYIWERYHYDKKGNLIKVENLGGTGGTPTKIYYYNSDNNLIKEEDETETIEYTYDAKGNRIKEIIYLQGNKFSEIEYTYKFWE